MPEDRTGQHWFDDMIRAGWQAVPEFQQERSAAVHTVRCAVPNVHALALGADPRWGRAWPRRIWRNAQDMHWLAFEWGDEGMKPLLGLVRDDQAGIVPLDAWRWKRHQENRLPAALPLPRPPEGVSFIDFESHFEAKWLSAPVSGPAPPASAADSIDDGNAGLLARAQVAEDEVIQYLDEHWPASPGMPDWTAVTSPLAWRMPQDDELEAIYTILRTNGPANFSLPDSPDETTVKLAVRDTAFYDNVLLVRLVDLRGERTRITHFLADRRSQTQHGLGNQSRPIHEFNDKLDAEGRLWINAQTCAEYVRFYCEFVQGDDGDFMVLWSPDNLDWLEGAVRERHPVAAIQPPRLRFPQPRPAEALARKWIQDRYGPVVAVCLAHCNYDRSVFVAAFVVQASGKITMVIDSAIQDSDWPVAPTLFDDEFQFRLSKARDAGTHPDIDRRDARASRRIVPAGLPGVLWGLPTGPGQLDPCRLRRHVEFHDAVDLRGHELNHALLLHGVVFWGRVDLRSVTVKGDVDLTRCVFREGLFWTTPRFRALWYCIVCPLRASVSVACRCKDVSI